MYGIRQLGNDKVCGTRYDNNMRVVLIYYVEYRKKFTLHFSSVVCSIKIKFVNKLQCSLVFLFSTVSCLQNRN